MTEISAPVKQRGGIRDAALWRAADIRVFGSEASAPRARRPTDVVLLVGTSLTIAVLTLLVSAGATPINDAVAGFIDAIPVNLDWFWGLTVDLLLVWAVVFLVIAVVARHRLALQQVVAGTLAFGGALLAGTAAGADWTAIVGSVLATAPPAVYPGMRLALATALIVTTSPHLSRPLRHTGRGVLAFGALGVIALGVTSPLGAIAGLALGMAAGSLTNLMFGSPGGRLSLSQVSDALADLGVTATDLRHADLAPRGVALVTGLSAAGRPLLVKVYGRDAWDGQLISSLWASLWYRDTMPSTRLNRLQQVEHEAFATLFAERAGVPVLPVVAAGLATGRDALLVLEDDAVPFTEVSAERLDDALLARLWAALRALHTTGIAHGRLTPDRLAVLSDGSPALADFGASVVAAKDVELRSDQAELLVSTALLVGPERAVQAAASAIGPDGLANVLPLLQPAAIEPSLRRDVRAQEWDVADLRARAAAVVGRDLPELEKVRRVSLGSLLQVALVALVAWVLISAISGIGLDTLVEEFKDAQLGWLLAAILVAPVVQVGQAFSTIGASIRRVRFGPSLALQYATQFLALAVPSSAARVALAVRFFQKLGANTTEAMAVGLIDSLAGFVIQALIITVMLISGAWITSGTGSTDAIDATTVLLILGLALLAILIALAIPKVRRFVRARAADGKAALRVLRSRRNVAMLFLGNFAAQALYAVVLWLSLMAFGETASFAQLLLINTLVSLFAGLMPVPGGIGVTEAALTAGLVAIGIPDSAAISAAIVYRVATYYLPPAYGAPAMSWLRKGSYI